MFVPFLHAHKNAAFEDVLMCCTCLSAPLSGREHHMRAQGSMRPQKRPSLLIAAFHADAWLQALRSFLQDVRAGLFAPVLGPAPTRLRTRYLDLHRMNAAQARAAVLEAVHLRLQELPGAEVEEMRAALLAEEMRLAGEDKARLDATSNGRTADSQPMTPEDAAVGSGGASGGGLTLVVGRGLNTPNRSKDIDRNALKLAVLDLCHSLQVCSSLICPEYRHVLSHVVYCVLR